MSELPTEGWLVSSGFEPVADAFQTNFAIDGELGASFAAFRGSTPMVDIWGGIADRDGERAWDAETMEIVFSGTKGLVATCLLVLMDRGLLDLDATVASYWPEFASHGKEAVKVREIVSHAARIPGLTVPVTWEEATDARRMADLVASQPLSSDPRAAATYHSLTFGWICAEMLRRIDGRNIGRFFAEEVAGPLELEIWIGLPEELENRVARVELAPGWGASPNFAPERLASDPLLRSVFGNPARYQRDSFPWNERSWHAAEVPGANGIGTARSFAKLYSNLDKLVDLETLELAWRPLRIGADTLLGNPAAYSVGFELQSESMPFGPVPVAFGHGGTGGSRHGCWVNEDIGFSYTMNLLRDDEGDKRLARLLGPLHHAIGSA
jgi:CubicO group peptidase (beta-lactamase class C family)